MDRDMDFGKITGAGYLEITYVIIINEAYTPRI